MIALINEKMESLSEVIKCVNSCPCNMREIVTPKLTNEDINKVKKVLIKQIKIFASKNCFFLLSSFNLIFGFILHCICYLRLPNYLFLEAPNYFGEKAS